LNSWKSSLAQEKTFLANRQATSDREKIKQSQLKKPFLDFKFDFILTKSSKPNSVRLASEIC
jgi:hypothetical protein